jgi:uncharacterized protein YceK
MKKLVLVVLTVGLVFSLSGCATFFEHSVARDALYYELQRDLAAMKEQRACELRARPGMDIVLSGVESFTCFGGGNQVAEADLRTSPAWHYLSQNSGILGMLGLSYLLMPTGIGEAFQVAPAPEVVQIPTQVVNPVIVRP